MVNCEHCGKDMDKIIHNTFLKFETGKVLCGSCHKLNKRYVSEFDLIVYLIGISAFLGLVLSIQLFTSTLFNQNIIVIIAFIAVVAFLLYSVLTGWAGRIYNDAPYKSEWKNVVINEDVDKVKKKYLFHLLAYLVITLILSPLASMKHFEWLYIGGIVVYLIYLVIVARKVYFKEKEEFKKINISKKPKE